jgi:hypothetical protein
MTIDLTTLDAHEQPSDELRTLWKKYSRTDHAEFANHPDIDELDVLNPGDFQLSSHISKETLEESFQLLQSNDQSTPQALEDVPIYFHPLLPGIYLPLIKLLPTTF